MLNKIKEKLKIDGEWKSIFIVMVVTIIVACNFLYFSYKINIGDFFNYKNETGIISKDITAIKVAYIVLSTLSLYVILMAFIIIKEIKTKSIKVEKIFLALASTFAILFIVAMPITTGHDESIHALRAYEYTEGKFINNGKEYFLEKGTFLATNYKRTYSEILNNMDQYTTNTNKIRVRYRVSTYSPVNYLPEIMGILTAKMFTKNVIVHLYTARVFSSIICIALLYFAIKKIPFGKNLLFLLCIIPTTIEGIATISADGLLFSASMFFISYILYLTYNKEKINKKDIAILAIFSVIIALSKTVYITLIPFIFIIPKEKWKNIKQKNIICFIIFIVALILDFLWYKFGIQKEEISNIGNDAILYILNSPIGYIQKIIYTIVLLFEKYLTEIFGATIEINEVIKISIFPYILFIMSIIVSIKGKNKTEFKLYQKIIIIFIVVACMGVIFSALFIEWSRPNLEYIEGIQGRYFLPILPIIYMIFCNKFCDERKYTYTIAVIGLLMQMCVTMELLLYHI